MTQITALNWTIRYESPAIIALTDGNRHHQGLVIYYFCKI